MANCAFPADLRKRVLLGDGKLEQTSGNSRDLLRPTKMVPTVNIGSERISDKLPTVRKNPERAERGPRESQQR